MPDHAENPSYLSFEKVWNVCGCTNTLPCSLTVSNCNHKDEFTVFFLLAIRLFELFWLRFHLYVV
jgi:hypothetical protein